MQSISDYNSLPSFNVLYTKNNMQSISDYNSLPSSNVAKSQYQDARVGHTLLQYQNTQIPKCKSLHTQLSQIYLEKLFYHHVYQYFHFPMLQIVGIHLFGHSKSPFVPRSIIHREQIAAKYPKCPKCQNKSLPSSITKIQKGQNTRVYHSPLLPLEFEISPQSCLLNIPFFHVSNCVHCVHSSIYSFKTPFTHGKHSVIAKYSSISH